MNEEVLATDRLERSAGRLEQAIADRISAVEKSAAKRVESLESEVNSLKSRLNSLQAEKNALATALEDAQVEYRVLENITDTVRDRLDETIGRLREVLSA